MQYWISIHMRVHSILEYIGNASIFICGNVEVSLKQLTYYIFHKFITLKYIVLRPVMSHHVVTYMVLSCSPAGYPRVLTSSWTYVICGKTQDPLAGENPLQGWKDSSLVSALSCHDTCVSQSSGLSDISYDSLKNTRYYLLHIFSTFKYKLCLLD